jgi:hypothetical protein
MKAMTKVLLGTLAIAIVVAVSVPVAEAQCATGARAFATVAGGSGTNKMRVNPAGTNGVLGQEFGRFWQCNDSSSGNNFVAGDPAKRMAAAGCIPPAVCCATQDPVQAGGGWWQVANTTERGIEGFISGLGCGASTCPVGDLCLVVEDWGPGGPPGVGATAFFVGWRTNETPPAIRYWDYSKQCGAQDTGAVCVVPFVEFPIPFITSATKVGADRAIQYDSNTDPSVNVYVHTPNAGPASALLHSYDLMIHNGPSDPGRDRNAACPGEPGGKCWNLLQSILYADAAIDGASINVPCDNTIDDAYIAFGMTFDGGPPGGPVPSQMVGKAIQVECDPNIADPKLKPSKTIRVDERPAGARTTPERSRGGR